MNTHLRLAVDNSGAQAVDEDVANLFKDYNHEIFSNVLLKHTLSCTTTPYDLRSAEAVEALEADAGVFLFMLERIAGRVIDIKASDLARSYLNTL